MYFYAANSKLHAGYKSIHPGYQKLHEMLSMNYFSKTPRVFTIPHILQTSVPWSIYSQFYFLMLSEILVTNQVKNVKRGSWM